jgi:hypothetical protein
MSERFTVWISLPAVRDELVYELFSIRCEVPLLMPSHDIPSSDRGTTVHKRQGANEAKWDTHI